MLDSQEIDKWCQSLNLSQAARTVIEQIRTAGPSRRVQGGRRNVCGIYPSKKMGVTIQFESHRHELARIYELEHDPEVLEYYDQPPPIELCYKAHSGRQNRHMYTPDFFVIRTNSAGWEECKSEPDLVKLSENSPNRYQKGEHGKWQCPPGEDYARRLGMSFRLWSSAETNWTFQQNFIWLEDYFSLEEHTVDSQVTQTVLALVEANPGILVTELLQKTEAATLDDIHTLIAIGHLYVNLNTANLSEPQKVKVFLNQEIALAYERLTEVSPPTVADNIQILQVAVGAALSWDGECWDVVNTGTTTTGLLRTDGKFVELPNAAFEELVKKGRIVVPETPIVPNGALVGQILRCARPQDVVEANRRYEILQPYLSKHPPIGITRTIRRWRNAYQEAEDLYGNGYIGLLPKHHIKGNRASRLDEVVLKFMIKFIQENYETLKQRGQLRVYESFRASCESHDPRLNPPSFNRFCQEIQRRSGYCQTSKREGSRAAIGKLDFYWQLELTTPRHGERPFEIVHIDHTQLDIELVSSLVSLSNCNLDVGNVSSRNLGRPWATFMVDAYSRRLLAIYLTFDEPSYRSCMAVLRICVQRFKRFPQTIVVDNGAEFHSHYFEQLLATYVCTNKHRPPANARFGSVVERLFGTANTQLIYELQGNTQITRNPRQVTKSVSPNRLAIWTLSDLYEAFCEWAYEVYDQREHPALGQTPRDAFNTGITLGGSRLHRRVEYDETFRILTLPVPERGKRKVQPGQGVKIHNIYYWSNTFRDPEVELSSVEVRYDPFDAGVAYALVKRQWVQCISNYYQYLQGRSEKEIRLISAELYKRKREQGRNFINSDRELVQFLSTVEAKEQRFLEQHLKATENQSVLQIIESSKESGSVRTHQHSFVSITSSEDSSVSEDSDGLQAQHVNSFKDSALGKLEYYGEF